MKKQDKEPFLDRVLLHSKNADERLFDMVLRFITFVILIIIIWIYADLAHAKADGLTLAQYYNIDFSKLTVSNENSLMFNIDDYIACLDEYTDITYDSNYHPPFQATGYVTNHDFVSEVVPDNCYSLYCYAGANLNGWYVFSIPKEIIDNGIAIWTRNGFYSTQDFTYYCGSVWYGTNVYPYGSFTFDSSSVHSLSVDQYCSSDNCYFSNCPLWTGTRLDPNVLGGPVNYSSVITDAINPTFEQSNALFNCNYFLYGDIMKQPWQDIADHESSKNHLALGNIQIGLTAFEKEFTNLDESQCVIGLDWDDDWITSHIDDYNILIQYDFYLKDSNINAPDPVSMYSTSVDLRYFMHDGYYKGVLDIMNECKIAPFPSITPFYNYYKRLNSEYAQKVVSPKEVTFRGIVPRLIGGFNDALFGSYTINLPSNSNNTIFEFYLDVSVRLSAEGESGGYYTKRFDFKRGTESIINADAFHNPYPWEGDPSPEGQYNPLVPSGNTSITNSGGNDVNNVNVQVNGNKIPMNVQNKQELNNTLTNYTNAFTTFTQSIKSLADTESQNNFYAVLSNTVPMIPGVNIYLQYVALTCGVMLILLVLKILLF